MSSPDSHLRFSGLPDRDQRDVFLDIIWADPLIRTALQRSRDLGLPDWRIVSGALYNTVWNALTGRPSGYGVKDIDVFYFDDSDVSYDAEDHIIQVAAPHFADLPAPVEIRNQARVHLWYEDHFGMPCAPLRSSDDSIARFASKTHSVGVRLLTDDRLDLYAPFGLDSVFSFRVVPNPVNQNRETHERKGVRAQSCWPEVVVEPWENGAAP